MTVRVRLRCLSKGRDHGAASAHEETEVVSGATVIKLDVETDGNVNEGRVTAVAEVKTP